jgi:hypothetical protein
VEFVGGLVDKIAEDVVDYRKPSLVEDIRGALQEGQKLMFAPDAVSGKGSCGTSARCWVWMGGAGGGATSGSWGRKIPERVMAKQG